MAHVPHLYLPGPWSGPKLAVSGEQESHLIKVLRIDGPSEITYTDGVGRTGQGRFVEGAVLRGEEGTVPRPSRLVVAVAPPRERDRIRFMVEKLAELAVERVQWLKTQFGSHNLPSAARIQAWSQSALEQSRGAWLTLIDDHFSDWNDLEEPLVVCDAAGDSRPPSVRTVAVGPEGGWSHGEIPDRSARWNLGPTILRTETAALVAISRLIDSYGNG